MPRLNENSIKLLINDLQEIDKVIKEILCWTGEVNSLSWILLDQNNTADSLKLINNYEGSYKDKYSFTLEIIVDRLKNFLRAFAAYLDYFPGDDEEAQLSKNAPTPSSPSLSDLINKLWIKAKAIYFFLSEENKNNMGKTTKINYCENPAEEKISSSDGISQNSKLSLASCENCYSSMSIMRSLLNELDDLFYKINKPSNQERSFESLQQKKINKSREVGRSGEYKTNQLAEIPKLANSLAADILKIQGLVQKHLSDLISRKQLKNQDTDETILQKEHTQNLKILQAMSYNELKAENTELSRQMKVFKQDLLTVQEELDMKTSEVHIFKNKYMAEIKSRKLAQAETQSVRTHIEELEEQLLTLQRHTAQLSDSWDMERNQIIAELEDIQRKLNIIKDEKDALVNIIDLINEKLSETENMNNNLKAEIKAMKGKQETLVRKPELSNRRIPI